MSVAPTYVQVVVTEAQRQVLKDLVKARITTLGPEDPDFENTIQLLGTLCMPVKLRQSA